MAKWLPVEGPIEKGNYWQAKDLSIQQGGSDRFIHHANESGCKKVKLFLCSRDIQVGDNYYPHSLWFEKDKNKPLEMNEKHLLTDTCFKVIGEVSPDTLSYVKEGDEFTEDSIKFQVSDHPPFEGFIDIPKEEFEKVDHKYWMKRIQIKGPCGRFH